MKKTKKVESDPAANSEFINTDQILERIPVSERTLCTWREEGKIPFVKLHKRVIYHWPSVREALLREQRGRQLLNVNVANVCTVSDAA